MIKIDRVPEFSEMKTEVSRGYLDIKPNREMTDQEASDFIANEFEKAHDEAELDTYDKLLSEVFNRSEDELNIDFDINDDLKMIIDKFRPKNWNLMEAEERMESIGELVKAIGKELHLENLPGIELMIEDDVYGFFDALENKMVLNDRYFDNPVELVNTIVHEMRHAYQHMRAEILDTWEDALYKVNFENYISPLPLPAGGYLFFTDYLDQYVEVEARAFANLFTEAMA